MTLAYFAKWQPMASWDASEAPPLVVEPRLLDIVHSPGKDGATVMKAVEKQLFRFGLLKGDVVNMVGDGGGENEGQARGMHTLLEENNPGYVRRRCLGHIAWRVADAMLSEVPHYDQVKAICAYLCSGNTWMRLPALASTPVVDGGLGLFAERSNAYAAIFARAPGAIVEGRPESDMNFLAFLGGKEQVLLAWCTRDVEDRALATSTADAIATLGDHRGAAERRVCAEMLHRALFLHHWVNKSAHISNETTLADLSERAKYVLQDLSLDERTMRRLGCEPARLAEKGWSPDTWLGLVATLEYGDELLGNGALPHLKELHLRLVSKCTSHLALVLANVARSTWTAGAILHRDPGLARTAALELLRHLDSVAPASRSNFETHLANADNLHNELVAFANREPAVCVWQGGGAFKELFKFLALRFLLAPDQVLDCERAHARWNWMCNGKRNLRLPLLNASLKLTTYLEANGMQFPPHGDLGEFLAREAAAFRVAVAAVEANEDIAPAYRRQVTVYHKT